MDISKTDYYHQIINVLTTDDKFSKKGAELIIKNFAESYAEAKADPHEKIVMRKPNEIDTSKLTRLTVVEKTIGRVVERRDIKINLDVQDDGRTLKIFYEKK